MFQTQRQMLPRRALWSMIVLGALITAVGGTGIFAVFTDQATTGPNSVESGGRAKAADLQIAIAPAPQPGGGIVCGTFSDHYSNNLFSASGVQPGDALTRYACLQNVGAAGLSVTVGALDLLDIDPECTGDEATIDPDCGAGDGFGQLSGVLSVSLHRIDCATLQPIGQATTPIQDLSTSGTPVPGGELAPADTACLRIIVDYPAETLESSIQEAQSDRVTWRFAFDGATSD